MPTRTQQLQRLCVIASLFLVLLLVLIAWVQWQDNQQQQALDVVVAPANTLRIERPGATPISLQKADTMDDQDAHWRITEPCVLPANPLRLKPLLEALAPKSHTYNSAEVDLQAAGLLTPVASLTLNGQTLFLGNTDLSGQRRYLQRGEFVEFVPEWVLSMINGGLSALAVPDVFPSGISSLRWVDDGKVPTNVEETGDAAIDRKGQEDPGDGDTGGVNDSLAQTKPSESVNRTTGTGASQATVMTSTDNAAKKALPRWRKLQAVQIVTWPLSVTETATATRHAQVITPAGKNSLTLYNFERFVALRVDNSNCAHILEPSTLPERLFP